jgi:hypothetical protein
VRFSQTPDYPSPEGPATGISGRAGGRGEVSRKASDRHNLWHRRTVDDRSDDDDPCDRLEKMHFYGRRVIGPSL